MGKNTISLAIIFTCFNRVEKTRKCIDSLKTQVCQYPLSKDYYICDDKSTDETVNVIKSLLPDATVVEGNGKLFWTRGMYRAMSEAVKNHHDFYLMVNDDVIFDSGAFETMLDSYYEAIKVTKAKQHNLCGIVGSTLKFNQRDISYGGWRYVHKLRIGRATLIKPDGKPIQCDLANWNCFMLPEDIIKEVGIIDPFYVHSKGDFDYSMMMSNKGYNIYIAKDYVGLVDNNENKWESEKKISQRIKEILSIKGVPPKYELYYFTKNWGILGFIFFFYSFPKTVIHELGSR